MLLLLLQLLLSQLLRSLLLHRLQLTVGCHHVRRRQDRRVCTPASQRPCLHAYTCIHERTDGRTDERVGHACREGVQAFTRARLPVARGLRRAQSSASRSQAHSTIHSLASSLGAQKGCLPALFTRWLAVWLAGSLAGCGRRAAYLPISSCCGSCSGQGRSRSRSRSRRSGGGGGGCRCRCR